LPQEILQLNMQARFEKQNDQLSSPSKIQIKYILVINNVLNCRTKHKTVVFHSACLLWQLFSSFTHERNEEFIQESEHLVVSHRIPQVINNSSQQW
jgi:hypothetical protein